MSLSDFIFEAEAKRDNRSCKVENFLPENSALCSFVFLPSEESWMTSAPLVLKASEIRFPAIAAPPVEDKSDMERIFNFWKHHPMKLLLFQDYHLA